MSEISYYVLDDNDCKHISLTKEQIYAAITEAIETGTITDVDTGFVTKIKEMNADKLLSFWIGTSAQYNTLTARDTNTLYILTDESTLGDAVEKVDELEIILNTFMTNTTDIQDEQATDISNLEGNLENAEGAITALRDEVEKRSVIYESATGIMLNATSNQLIYYDSTMTTNPLRDKIIEIEWKEMAVDAGSQLTVEASGITRFRAVGTVHNYPIFKYHKQSSFSYLDIWIQFSTMVDGDGTHYEAYMRGKVSANAPDYASNGGAGIYITKVTVIDKDE